MVKLLQCVIVGLMSGEVAAQCAIPTGVANQNTTSICNGGTLEIADGIVCTGACLAGFTAEPLSATCAGTVLPAIACNANAVSPIASPPASSPPAWDYSNTAWTIGDCASSTANQSPIDIQTAATVQGSVMTPPSAFSFDSQGFPDSATTEGIQSGLVINEHTVEVEWDSPNTNATDEYGLVIGDRVYKLAQFHYHSPSEHLVNGQHFDMEAHHVHFCDGPSCLTPDIHNDEILVVAVFLKAGAENVYLQSFWGDFVAGSEPEIENLANPYTAFLPTDKSYYSYTGSTTTPPCATNVQWILMENSVDMSAAQLTAYHTIVNTLPQPFAPAVAPVGVTAPWVATTKCNNRPPQQLGTRIVGHFTQPVAESAPEDPLHPSTVSGFPWWQLLVALAALALLVAGVCFFLNQKADKPKATRAVKPKAPKAAPKEETVPLMPAPQLLAPNLSMIVQPQPLMMQQPQAYTTMARPMAPYGQSPYGP